MQNCGLFSSFCRSECQSAKNYFRIKIAYLQRMKERAEKKCRDLIIEKKQNVFVSGKELLFNEGSDKIIRIQTKKIGFDSPFLPNDIQIVINRSQSQPNTFGINYNNLDTKKVRIPMKRHSIFTPQFFLLGNEDSPYEHETTNSENLEEFINKVKESHKDLEIIEDRVRIGLESRVNNASTLINVYELKEEYKIDRLEQKKVYSYPEKVIQSVRLPSWPTRVYDHLMKEADSREVDEITTLRMQFAFKKTLAQEEKKEKASTPKKLVVQIPIDDFATDNSDQFTDNEDFNIDEMDNKIQFALIPFN